MTIPLEQIAELVGGEIHGDPRLQIEGAQPPWEAGAAEITMLDDPRHLAAVVDSTALAVVTPEQVDLDRAQIVVADPHTAFEKIVALFRPPINKGVPSVGIDDGAAVDETAIVHLSATVAAGARIGARTVLMPGVVVMPHCRIGDDCVVHAGVTLYEYTRIDDRVVIHAGTVIGANGFGYRLESGRHIPTAQLGYVHVESDVEIGAAVTIDRGTFGATRIGEGTKIDNQVMIGHNCQIGKHNLLCSQVGIAGSCRTGDYVVLAGQVGLKDHITLGDHTIVGAQAGVMDDCQGGEVYLGSPATTQRNQMQIMAVERRLPEMRREVKQLRRDLAEVQQRLPAGDDATASQDSRAA
jgi:UDP-3-O-[3-hydroxymyristoyl] glucosamine N-acyltransferase